MIADLKIGQPVTGFFLLKQMELKTHEGGNRLALILGDRTGEIDAVKWEDAADTKAALSSVRVVKVKGTVDSYRGRLQVRIEKIRTAQEGEFDPVDLKRAATRTSAQLRAEISELIDSVANPPLHTLLNRFREQAELFERYLVAPAGKRWHHDFEAGLAEHSLSLARLCDVICKHYPVLERDLLVTGALLHDLGKVEEFEGDIVHDYSDAGRLIGHITIGDHLVLALIAQVEDFPPVLALKLRHLVLSHHGKVEYGASVTPKTREAHVLHYLDEIDSKLDAIGKIAERTEGPWSEYIQPLSDYLFFG